MHTAFERALAWTIAAGALFFAALGAADLTVRDDARTLVTLLGALGAVFAFVYNAVRAREQSREQHTIKVLFDSRLSAEFRGMLEDRKRVYPEGQVIADEAFMADLRLPGDAVEPALIDRRKAAEAVRALLNYYEFIALGVARRDLDETFLRETIRGIMCALVRDCRHVIDARRAENPDVMKHLAALYAAWKRPEDPPLAERP